MRKRTTRTAAVTGALLVVAAITPSAAPASAGSAPPATSASQPMLSLGDRGEEVKVVQRRVGVVVDGRYGEQTRRAVQSLQSAAGLAADGIVGPLTWAVILGGPASTGAGGSTSHPELSLGATGPAVTEAQSLLTRSGHRTAADGRFGPATFAALVAFQRDHGLQPDGVIGSRTWAALGSGPTSSYALRVTAPSSAWRIIGSQTHVVKTGESWTGIAAAHASTPAALAAANRLPAGSRPPVGATIQVPGSWKCPVPGATFVDDYGVDRPGGRVHEGNDMFAARGTAVRAPVGGRVEPYDNSLGGTAIRLYGNDGNRYYFAHLERYGATGTVAAGTTIGYVGNSGDAAGGPTHLHFEAHPNGGDAVDPFPTITLACRH